jgi:hypothetical protein
MKYIIMTGRRCNIKNGSTSLIIDGEQIERVTMMKYLGVEIDEKLDFKQHVDSSFLGRIQQKLTKTAKITTYNSIISPHLEYCPSILFLANEEYWNRMQIIQNKAMWTILRCHRRSHVETMLDNLEWQSTTQRIYMNMLVFIFKIKHNMAPDYLASKLLYTREATTHVLMIFVCHSGKHVKSVKSHVNFKKLYLSQIFDFSRSPLLMCYYV